MISSPGKHVADSAIEDFTYRIFPNDLNSNGTVFGGLIMSMLDRIALVVCERHCGLTCVTASVDAMHFLAPAGEHDHLIIKGAINRVWRTSMEVGLKVISHNPKTQEKKHIISAYFTFVALDDDQKPTKIPQIIPVSPDEKRRYEEAELRRMHRFEKKQIIQASRAKRLT